MEAPSSLFDCKKLKILFLIALNTPFASTPGCLKKFLSSDDRNALIIFFGIALKGTNILFSAEKSLISTPFPEYTLLDTAGL